MADAEAPQVPKVRGRGACKFGSAFGGSGLLAWSSDDPTSAPSKEAQNPWRGGKPSDRRPLSPPAPSDSRRGRGGSHADRRPRRSEEAGRHGGRPGRRRQRSEEGSPARGSKRRRRSDSRRRRRTPERRREPKKPEPRTQWVRVINVPTVVQSKHLQNLFKTSLGGVVSCTVDDGIASVCFETPDLAERAVVKYNNGEINGCTINVQLDFTPQKTAEEAAARKSPRPRSSERKEAAGEDPKDEGPR